MTFPLSSAGKIFLLQSDDTLQSLTQQPYSSEDLLQTLLERYPDLMAGDQINQASPRRWLLIDREYGVPGEEEGPDRWSLDHLFLDQDAVPTLVEVKRASDTRIRREVVGQMLDYAANAVVYWPVENIRARFEANCEARGNDPAGRLAELTGNAEASPETFWEQVKANLQTGRIRLVFVADQIPAELRRIVEFLNRYMNPVEVLAVEIRQFVGEGLRTLVPRVLGLTAEAEQRKGAVTRKNTRQWDEASFFTALAQNSGAAACAAARRIVQWAQERGVRVWWGEGAQLGSFVLILDQTGRKHYSLTGWTSGVVEVQFQHMRSRPPFDNEMMRRELLQRLNSIPGISLPDDSLNRRPSFPFSSLTDEEKITAFLKIWDWYIDTVKAHNA